MRVPKGYCRNESSPTQGIDTSSSNDESIWTFSVEMRVARLRALTQVDADEKVLRDTQ